MIYLKACPKCKGDLTDSEDEFGAYTRCFQCGFGGHGMTSTEESKLRKEVGKVGMPAGKHRAGNGMV